MRCLHGLRAIVAVGVIAASALVTSPAQAGGWAATVIDPVPDRMVSGRTYTIGFWVLQHGTHPYEGKLGTTGLQLVAPAGKKTFFPGVALREPGHFAAAIALPGSGRWTVYGVQGLFGADRVGTLTLPGRLSVTPRPAPATTDEHASHWGDVRPPYLVGSPNVDGTGGVNPSMLADPPRAAEQTAARPTRASSSDAPLLVWIGAVAAVLLVGVAVIVRRRRRTSRDSA